MVFLEQKWLWAKLPIKLPLRVPHRSPELNKHNAGYCTALSSTTLPGWSCGVLISDCCNGYSLSPSDWRYCSHLHRPDPALSYKLSLCSAPVLALSPGCVSQAQHMPSTVCNSAYSSFSLALELAHTSPALVPYTDLSPLPLQPELPYLDITFSCKPGKWF